MKPQATPDLARILFIVAILCALTIGSLYVMRPFLPGLIWATTIVVATWPAMIGIERRCGNRRWLATLVMLVILLVVIVLPLYEAVSTLAVHGGEIMDVIRKLPDYALTSPPEWIREIPVVGERIAGKWQEFSDAGPSGLLAQLEPYATIAAHWLIGHAASVGVFVMHMFITIIITGILYSQGEHAAAYVTRFAIRVAPAYGEQAVKLAGASIRAVALGIVVTAILQSALGGIGLAVAGVPGAGVLTAVMLMLCLAQIGPTLPLLGGVIWLFMHDAHVVAILLAVWSVMVAMLDNLVRPVLIRRGVNLSMLLILSGVLGGLFAFGIVGLFIGPVILAVSSTLLTAWIRDPAAGVRDAGEPATRQDV
ncbi:AI-2E family transporter YdiK [Paraburkholderia unamae]|uniref:PurR-regulated permease PerM n=1 Tax=Paraburkholderia unamae TaxID=219649 RepID=A0ABX5KUJ7_9BURK|nr:AI-2E family transporter YdiK [Paraburkholderia unamae]PVX86703.1 putative PurR-regulated permease PerM [Paraburkholderia unamae]CAG9274235.1 Putative transport protein YdiK [Paraburkholderia unamae]